MPNTFHTGGQPDDQLCEFRDDQSHDRCATQFEEWDGCPWPNFIRSSFTAAMGSAASDPTRRQVHDPFNHEEDALLNISKNWQIHLF